MRKLTVRISRYDPERDDRPHWEAYQVEADPMDRVLDVLLRIKWEQDNTLALRFSCAHGVCGSDAMRINGFNRLACKTLVGTLPEETLTIEPLLALLPKVRRRWQQMCVVKADLHAPSAPRLLRGGCQGGVTPPAYPL